MQVRVEFLDEGEICGVGVFTQILKIERQPVITRELREEALKLETNLLAFSLVLEQLTHGRIEALGMGVEIVQMGKDFGVFARPLNGAFDLVQIVGIVNNAPVKDGKFTAVLRRAHQGSRGRFNMKPLWKEQIDLMDVLFQGRVAGSVVRDVIGDPQTFAGVEGNFRRLTVSLAASGSCASSRNEGADSAGLYNCALGAGSSNSGAAERERH